MNNEWKVSTNGVITNGDEPILSPLDAGFQYGQGLFETIKVTDGKPWFLDEHIGRLTMSCRDLGVPLDTSQCSEAAVEEFLERADLTRGLVRLKVIATKGVDSRGKCLFMGREEEARNTVNIACGVYPERRSCPLARHKTLNYAYYFQAREWAKKNGFDYGILIDANGSILEADMANLFVYRQGSILRPPTGSNRLLGIMEKVLCEKVFPSFGLHIVEQEIRPKDIEPNDILLLSNSMIECVPVVRLGSAMLSSGDELAERARSAIREIG